MKVFKNFQAVKGSHSFKKLLLSIAIATVTSLAHADNNKEIFDISPEQPERIHVVKNDRAIEAIPANYRFIKPGKLVVAVSPTDPPISFYASDAKTAIGADPDLASALAESLGLEIELVPITWVDWSLGLASGKYDAVLANVGVTEDRKKKFDFSTYREGLHGFYTKTDSPIGTIEQPEDIAGLRVIVGAGTNQERILLRWNDVLEQQGLTPMTLQYYDDGAVSLLAIQSGRADVIVQPNAQLVYISARDGNITPKGTLSAGWPDRSDVAVATRKDSGLAEPITIALNGLIESGDYQKILDKWFLGAEALKQAETNPLGLPSEAQ